MKILYTLLLMMTTLNSWCQWNVRTETVKIQANKIKIISNSGVDVATLPFEKPVNFFLAAGIGVNTQTTYSVAISPYSLNVQFQDRSIWTTGISSGMYWTPFKKKLKEGAKVRVLYKADEPKQLLREGIAIALLIDVFKLSFSEKDLVSDTSLKTGLGLGWKNNDFMVLLTLTLNNISQPRDYFIDQYKDQNKKLILNGTTEPVQMLDKNDNDIFVLKQIPSLGLKLAYAFSKKPE